MLTFIKTNFLAIVLVILFGLIFFFRLDYNTLASWDEAWYATISREIVRSGNYLDLTWNGTPYFDHPPLGFWLMAVSYTLIGINEFSTRLPSAIAGILSIIFLYKIGELLFKSKLVGFASSVILGTSVWYVIRVRSGNLDSLLVFFYIATVYFAVKSSTNMRWFPITTFCFACLMLTKTLVGLPALFLIIILISNQLHYKKIIKNTAYLLLGIIVLAVTLLPWYMYSINTHPTFFDRHFIQIGLRNHTNASTFTDINPIQPLFFLHMGIRKWYYLWIVASSIILASGAYLKKNFFTIIFWNAAILYPFLATKETELWHLIPVYIPVSLITGSGLYLFKTIFENNIGKIIFTQKITTKLSNAIFFLFIMTISLWQIKTFYAEVFPINKYTPDDVAVAKKAGTYGKTIYLDDDFTPIATYYSQKNITSVAYLPEDRNTLTTFFRSDAKNFIVITRNWAVENLIKEKIAYKELYKNNTYSIVSKQ